MQQNFTNRGGQNRLKADSHSNYSHSHTLPKIAISLALLFGGANIALAEESGGFVGVELGGGGANMELKVNYLDADINTELSQKDKLLNGGGINYGFTAGYKQFFNEYLGLRYYANLNVSHTILEPTTYMKEVSYDTITKTQYATMLNYGVNVDFLGNFVVTDIVDFGGFVGVGLGGDSWFGSVFDDYLKSWQLDDSISAETNSWKLKKTSFNVWLNIGLRTNIATHHGIELVAKVPFIKTMLLNEKLSDNSFKVKTTIANPYNVALRYTFSF